MWAEKLLEQLWKAQVYSQCLNTDYEGELKNFGDTVKVSTLGPVTISDYTTNTVNLTPEVLTGAAQSMLIDQAKYFYFSLDDVDKAQIKGAVMEQAMKQSAYGIRDKTDQFLAALLVAGAATANIMPSGASASSTTNPILLGSGSGLIDGYELMVDMARVLDEANVPANDRFIVVPPKFAGLLLKDPRFTSFATTQAIETAKVGSTAGGSDGTGYGQGFGTLPTVLREMSSLTMYVSNNVPSTGTSPNQIYSIVAGQKMAASYAQQIAEGQPEAFRLQTGFADAVRGLHLYGGKVFRPDCIALAYGQFA